MVSLRGRRSKREGEGNSRVREGEERRFLSLALALPSRFSRAPDPLFLSFRTPAMQASEWFNLQKIGHGLQLCGCKVTYFRSPLEL